jgi:hypothetical protein
MAGSSFATELDYIRGLVNSSSPQCTRFFSKAFSLFKACLKRRLIVSDDPEITALQYLGQIMVATTDVRSARTLSYSALSPEMRHLTLRSKDSGDLT